MHVLNTDCSSRLNGLTEAGTGSWEEGPRCGLKAYFMFACANLNNDATKLDDRKSFLTKVLDSVVQERVGTLLAWETSVTFYTDLNILGNIPRNNDIFGIFQRCRCHCCDHKQINRYSDDSCDSQELLIQKNQKQTTNKLKTTCSHSSDILRGERATIALAQMATIMGTQPLEQTCELCYCASKITTNSYRSRNLWSHERNLHYD